MSDNTSESESLHFQTRSPSISELYGPIINKVDLVELNRQRLQETQEFEKKAAAAKGWKKIGPNENSDVFSKEKLEELRKGDKGADVQTAKNTAAMVDGLKNTLSKLSRDKKPNQKRSKVA